MKRLTLAMVPWICVAALFIGEPARAQSGLHAVDLRLLAVADRLQKANALLCDRLAPSLGVSLQSKDQFAAGTDPGFAAPVAFAVVLPGGTASRAGISENDGLVSVAGAPIVKLDDLQGMPLRDSAYAMLASIAAKDATRLQLGVQTGDSVRQVVVEAPPECRALVEIVAGERSIARSDGRVIQIGEALARKASDSELAVIFAHELAHSVLRHRDRLSSLDVDKGLGGEFGRDRQLNGEAEIEADRMSVHLLANAGYDPAIAAAFWRGAVGREVSGGLFRSRIYSSAEGRAQMLEREIADYLSAGAPSWPGHLLARRP